MNAELDVFSQWEMGWNGIQGKHNYIIKIQDIIWIILGMGFTEK